ncbi:MAG: ABC transporter substrate-binding protein, partial [Thermodesulfobacteriota bacterium]|nr:ABC transporter substrate-binding protein [Thermodesulfobacteriota bacterium]
MKRIKLLTALVGYLIFSMGPHGAEAANVQGITDTEIKLGGILTQSGPIAIIGVPIINGINDYINYINEEGGIHGRKIKMLMEDDQFKVPKAIAAYNKLWHRDKVFTLLGAVGCGQGVSLLPQWKKHNLVTFPLSSCREFSQPFSRECFMIYRDYDDEVYVMF